MDYSLLSASFDELLRERHVGERINPHVVVKVDVPKPDFDAMKRLIEGDSLRSDERGKSERDQGRDVPKDE